MPFFGRGALLTGICIQFAFKRRSVIKGCYSTHSIYYHEKPAFRGWINYKLLHSCTKSITNVARVVDHIPKKKAKIQGANHKYILSQNLAMLNWNVVFNIPLTISFDHEKCMNYYWNLSLLFRFFFLSATTLPLFQ